MPAKKNAPAKKTAAKKTAAKKSAPSIKKGEVVVFTGWDGDAPEGAEDIIEGMIGKVRTVSAEEVEVAIDVDGETVVVPFAPSEIRVATKSDIAKAKAAAEEEEEEDDDSDDEEEEEESDDDEEEESDDDEDEDEATGYEEFTVKELREECADRELSKSGSREELVARLVANDNGEDEEEEEEEEAPKSKSKAKQPAKTKTKAKGKAAADEDDEDGEEEEEDEPAKPARQPSLGKLADEGDKAAVRELTKRCKAIGFDEMAYETWREVERELKIAEKEASRPELVLSPSVQEEIGDDGKSAVAAAKRLVETAERTYYTLGGVLAYIDRNATYESVKVDGEKPYQGKEGFEQFCEENLGIAYRKAKYLIAIYEAFSGAGLTDRKIQAIGWSKAKELVAILREEPEQADKWIETAKKVSTSDLKEKVKTRLTKIGAKQHGNSKTVSSVVCRFVVHEDEGDVVNEALALAKEQAETESDSAAFAYIMKEWLTLQG